ncbi:MAG: hypothetical protein ACSHX5_06720 [Phycisphaerales bacterium]
MRGQMRGVTSEGNLATIGQVGAMYALDHEDRIFSFTWRGGQNYLDIGTGKTRFMNDDQEAGARQLQNILYRATGRTSGATRIYAAATLLVHRRFSHQVLADYMGGNVSDPMWVDPADANLLYWQANPLEFYEDKKSTLPYDNGFPGEGYEDFNVFLYSSTKIHWPFASSYHTVPHAWTQDFDKQYIPIADSPHLFQQFPPSFNTQLGERRHTEVVFPSAKVWMHEEFDREQGGEPYFAYDHARPAKLMFDGSINTAMSGQAQSSVSPEDYLNGDKFVWEQKYVPLDTFPVPLGGLGDETLLNMRYRWTLGGLTGVDYPQVFMRGNGR